MTHEQKTMDRLLDLAIAVNRLLIAANRETLSLTMQKAVDNLEAKNEAFRVLYSPAVRTSIEVAPIQLAAMEAQLEAQALMLCQQQPAVTIAENAPDVYEVGVRP